MLGIRWCSVTLTCSSRSLMGAVALVTLADTTKVLRVRPCWLLWKVEQQEVRKSSSLESNAAHSSGSNTLKSIGIP